MDPLYYIQVGDIHPLEENRLRILIDWGGLKGLDRKGLKDLKGSKQGVKARQKDQNVAMVSSSCSRSQLLQLWRTRKRPQRPKKTQQERWPPKRNSEGWSSAKRAVAKLREKGFNRWSAVRPASSEWVEIEEEEPLPEYKHSPPIDAPAASYNQKFYLSLPRYESFVWDVKKCFNWRRKMSCPILVVIISSYLFISFPCLPVYIYTYKSSLVARFVTFWTGAYWWQTNHRIDKPNIESEET